jgi:DNA repair exonuclease SbcCD ATPase subunit
VRASARIRGSNTSSIKSEPIELKQQQQQKLPKTTENTSSMITVRMSNNRKLHVCEKCDLEFTSGNSVLRHQEKSCLRVRIINLASIKSQQQQETTSTAGSFKKKCPICSSIFFNTHRLSIHIYKHHRNLLGSANQPPTHEAKRLNEIQLKKLVKKESKVEEEVEDEADEEEEEEDDEEGEEELEEEGMSHVESSDELSTSISRNSSKQKNKTTEEETSRRRPLKRQKSSDSTENSNIPSDTNCTLDQAF